MKNIIVIAGLAISIFLLYEDARFEIGDNDQVVITQFGKVAGPACKVPGEYFKIPFVQKTNYFKKNHLLSKAAQEIQTKDHEIILCSSTIYWEIADPIKFYQTLRSDQTAKMWLSENIGALERANVRSHELSGLILSGVPDGEGNLKFKNEIEQKIKDLSQEKLDVFGINLVGYEAKIHNTGRRETS